jgi:hypothetical protein
MYEGRPIDLAFTTTTGDPATFVPDETVAVAEVATSQAGLPRGAVKSRRGRLA